MDERTLAFADRLAIMSADHLAILTSITNGPTASSDNSLSSAGAAYVITQ